MKFFDAEFELLLLESHSLAVTFASRHLLLSAAFGLSTSKYEHLSVNVD